MIKRITLPLSETDKKDLKTGDCVYLSGTVYTARDAAHKRMYDAIQNGERLPFDIDNATVYYVGPCPSKPDKVIGSCGPTTSIRCDKYTPILLDRGLKAMIGKGKRSTQTVESIVRNGAVYFCAIGGAGAIYADCVTSCETVAYPELGTEAIRKLTVRDFPVIVAIDCTGNSIFI